MALSGEVHTSTRTAVQMGALASPIEVTSTWGWDEGRVAPVVSMAVPQSAGDLGQRLPVCKVAGRAQDLAGQLLSMPWARNNYPKHECWVTQPDTWLPGVTVLLAPGFPEAPETSQGCSLQHRQSQ
jgi:hypothetical protein